MNADIHLEDGAGLCDRLNRTRDNSQRQLPTDHDYAVSTREYQTDQSSLKPALTAAGPVLEKQRQNKPPDSRGLTRSLHIRDLALFEKAVTSQWQRSLSEKPGFRPGGSSSNRESLGNQVSDGSGPSPSLPKCRVSTYPQDSEFGLLS